MFTSYDTGFTDLRDWTKKYFLLGIRFIQRCYVV